MLDFEKGMPVDPPPPPTGDPKESTSIAFNQMQAPSSQPPSKPLMEVPGEAKSSPLALTVAVSLLLIVIAGTGGYFLGRNSVTTTPEATQSSAVVEPSPTPLLSPSPTPTPPATVGIGDEVKSNSGLTLTVEKVWLDSVFAKGKAASTQSQINVQVIFANKETIPGSYTASMFRLKDSKNQEYKVFLNASKEYQALSSGAVLSGETTKGGISFVVPKAEKSFRLIYENAVIEFSIPSSSPSPSPKI